MYMKLSREIWMGLRKMEKKMGKGMKKEDEEIGRKKGIKKEGGE